MSEEPKTLVSMEGSAQEPGVSMQAACLSEDDILAFVQGQTQGGSLELLHAHVDACSVCQQLVAEAVHALDSEPISDSGRTSWNAVFQPHSMVANRYRIVRLVARGGMGEVYEAHDTALHERVALKTVTSTSSDSAQAVRYLKAEVQLARRVTHPNVCRIYDFGTHVMGPSRGEINFLVMEFVEGECLGRRLRQLGALPLEIAQSIAQQLLLGLRAAHQAGILHRDLKSDNVMLRHESGGRVTPVILDFGLAKALNENGDLVSARSQRQGVAGTINYMAPEQIDGEPLSTATDIYSFGLVWFEMLTGRLPFERETPAASMVARLSQPPVAPSSINPQVPSWLDDIVLHCLARHRKDRFGLAEQVLEAIERGASLPSRASHVRLPWPIVALAALLALAAAGVLILREPLQHQGATTRAKPPHSTDRDARALVPSDSPRPPQRASGVTNPGPPLPARSGSALPKPRQPRPATANGRPSMDSAAIQHASEAGQGGGRTRPAVESTASAGPREPDWLPIWSETRRSEAPPAARD